MSLRVYIYFLMAALLLTPRLYSAENSDLDKLQGKWEAKRTTEDGQKVIMVLEINKDKLTFKILDEDRNPRFFAKADLKLEKLGPFSEFSSKNIKAGSSEDFLEPVDEDYSHIYQLDDDTWYVTSNFDRLRERPPSLDIYRKIK